MSDQFDVRYIAQLARLELSADEIAKFQSQLGQVLSHVEKLGQVDVSAVEPTAHANQVVNVFRADEARAWFTRASNAGMPEAQVALAEMMVNGRGGSRDLAAASAHVVVSYRTQEAQARAVAASVVIGRACTTKVRPVSSMANSTSCGQR